MENCAYLRKNPGYAPANEKKTGGWPNSCDGEAKLSRAVMIEYIVMVGSSRVEL